MENFPLPYKLSHHNLKKNKIIIFYFIFNQIKLLLSIKSLILPSNAFRSIPKSSSGVQLVEEITIATSCDVNDKCLVVIRFIMDGPLSIISNFWSKYLGIIVSSYFNINFERTSRFFIESIDWKCSGGRS